MSIAAQPLAGRRAAPIDYTIDFKVDFLVRDTSSPLAASDAPDQSAAQVDPERSLRDPGGTTPSDRFLRSDT